MSLISANSNRPLQWQASTNAAVPRPAGVPEQLRHADHAVQRRAQLVAHGGQEHALGAVGRFRVFLGGLQGFLRPLVIGDVRGRWPATASCPPVPSGSARALVAKKLAAITALMRPLKEMGTALHGKFHHLFGLSAKQGV